MTVALNSGDKSIIGPLSTPARNQTCGPLISVSMYQTINLYNRDTNAKCSLLLSNMSVDRLLDNLKPVEFLMAHRNCLFDHEKSPRIPIGDITAWR